MKGKLLIQGKGASQGVAVGRVRVVNGDEEKLAKIEAGDIIVADKLRPEHDIYMKKAGAFVTNVGGVTSHAAIVAREWGLPCIVGTMGEGDVATEKLTDGQEVVVDATEGKVYQYEGPPLPIAGAKPAVETLADKMAKMAAAKGISLDPAFLEKMKHRG